MQTKMTISGGNMLSKFQIYAFFIFFILDTVHEVHFSARGQIGCGRGIALPIFVNPFMSRLALS